MLYLHSIFENNHEVEIHSFLHEDPQPRMCSWYLIDRYTNQDMLPMHKYHVSSDTISGIKGLIIVNAFYLHKNFSNEPWFLEINSIISLIFELWNPLSTNWLLALKRTYQSPCVIIFRLHYNNLSFNFMCFNICHIFFLIVQAINMSITNIYAWCGCWEVTCVWSN